jgi:hypothetical protein
MESSGRHIALLIDTDELTSDTLDLLEKSEAVHKNKTNNFVALARKRTIPTEQPPLVGEVSANCCG